MYRFGQNDGTGSTYTATTSSSALLNNNFNNSTANTNGVTNGGGGIGASSSSLNSNLNTRNAVKRSVSQVPTTERRPLISSAPTQAINNTNTANYTTSNEYSNSLESKVNNAKLYVI